MNGLFKKLLRWWNRAPRYRQGEVLTFWPAMDLCRNILIADVTRIEEGIIGIRVRTYGMLRRTSPIPEFGDIQFIPLADLPKVGWTYDRYDPLGTKEKTSAD